MTVLGRDILLFNYVIQVVHAFTSVIIFTTEISIFQLASLNFYSKTLNVFMGLFYMVILDVNVNVCLLEEKVCCRVAQGMAPK